MEKIKQVALRNIFENLMKDDDFAHSIVKSVIKAFGVSQWNNDRTEVFENIVDQIIEYCNGRKCSKDFDIAELKDDAHGMLNGKGFLSFGRVLRMLQDIFSYSDARLINYLKRVVLLKEFDVQSNSPWIDIPRTSKAIREGLDPKKMEIFAKSNYEERCILRSFSSKQWNIMSNFSPKEINIFSRLIRLPAGESTVILSLEKQESRLFKEFRFDTIRILFNLQNDQRNAVLNFCVNNRSKLERNSKEISNFVQHLHIDDEQRKALLDVMIGMNDDQLNIVRRLCDRDTAVLGKLTKEAADLAENIHEMSREEKNRYLNLNESQLDVLKNLTDEQKNVLMRFQKENPSLKEILQVANSLNSDQRDLIFSLRQQDIKILVESKNRGTLSQIEAISYQAPEMIRSSSAFNAEEGQMIMGLNKAQKSTLLKAYTLGHDGLFMIHKLGPELTNQIFERYLQGGEIDEKLSGMQIALMRKIEMVNKARSKLPFYFNKREIGQLFAIMYYEPRPLLLNLSWRGIRLLERLTQMDDDVINIVQRLTKNNMEILTRNDMLTETEIFELNNLSEKEAEVLIGLNIKQREYLYSKNDLIRLHPTLFNSSERDVLENLSETGRRILFKIIPLSKSEKRQIYNVHKNWEVILKDMNPMEFDLFSTLSAEKIRLLSSFMIWHAEEDVVFTLLAMNFDKSDKIETLVNTIPIQMKNSDRDNIFKLLACTIETLRLSGRISDGFINTITSMIERIHGRNFSLLFKLHLLNLSMRDSKSLESLLVPQITGNQQDIYSISRTNEIHTIEDVIFMKWILSQPPQLNGGIFYEFAMATLIRLSFHMTGQELDILLSDSIPWNGIRHEQIVNNFKTILKANDYFVASSFFLVAGREKTAHAVSDSIIETLVENLTPDDCFQLLDAPINQFILDKISSSELGYRDILSDERFPNPNVLEVSLYYNLGNPLPLLETLEKSQLWKLFEKRSYSMLQLVSSNYRTDLFELCQQIRPLNKLMKENRISIIKSIIQDLEYYKDKSSRIDLYLNKADSIRNLGYLDSFVGKESYIALVSEYMSSLEERVSRGGMNLILDSFVTEDVNRRDIMKSLENRFKPHLYSYLRNDDENRSCQVSRKKKDIRMICADSRNTKEIESEEIGRSIEQFVDISMGETKLENLKLYNELLEYSERTIHGEQVDPHFEDSLISTIKNVRLESIDPRIADIVRRMKDNTRNQREIGSILRTSGIANKINQVASASGLALTAFFVGNHIMHKDAEGLGYDAMNFWVLPKIGEQISEKLTDLAVRYDSAITKGFAPAIGAAVSNLVVFVDLMGAIRTRTNAVDATDVKLADLNIITDSALIATNIPAVTTQIMWSFGAEISVVGELSGPIGLALSSAIIVTSYLMSVEWEAEKFKELIKLSNQEERSLYWRIFWNDPIPENIRIDLTAKEMYTHYISNHLHHFKGNYDQIALSLPRFLMTDSECVPNVRTSTQHHSTRKILPQMKCHSECTIGATNRNHAMDFSEETFARNPFSMNHGNHNSRLLPDELQGYHIVCGPTVDDAVEENLGSDYLELCPFDSVHRDTKWNVQTKKLFIPFKTDDDCKNMVAFRKHGTSNSSRILFYLTQNASIELSSANTIDMMFHGGNILITDRNSTEQIHNIPVNRYYFQNQLHECEIHKKGHNFFYLKENQLKCDLGNKTDQQYNTVVIRNSFIDSNNIHSILGSENYEKIEAKFAEYVDGKGGGDVIQATERTVVKGYFKDFITGKCLVLLPLNVTDIDSVQASTGLSVRNKHNLSIDVNQNVALMTADGYFLVPIRTSKTTHKVTHIHLRKTLETKILLKNQLPMMRTMTIPNCFLIKQLSSANYDIILSDVGRNIFHADKNHHGFYWESSGDDENLYVLGKLFANVTISRAHGIIDFQDLKMKFDPGQHLFHRTLEHGLEVTIGGLHVTLLPNYKNVTITFDGKEYYNVDRNGVSRDWCSHSLPIVGKIMFDATDTYDYPNCFEFDSPKVIFLQLGNDLILVSGKGVLTILKFYSSVYRRKEVSLKLYGEILVPNVFQQRADNPHKFVYYNVTSTLGLQIYHNQPLNERYIGIVNLQDKSIKDFNMTVINRNLLLFYRNVSIVQIENWDNYQPGRQLMFVFKDTFLDNARCILSYCKPNDIVEEFQIGKSQALHKKPIVPSNNASGRSSWINNLVNFIMKPIHNTFQSFFRTDHLNHSHSTAKLNDQYLNQFDYRFHIISNVNLVLVLFQHFLNTKYPLPKAHPTTNPEEILVDVMNLTEKYERLLNHTARRFNVELKSINYFLLYSDILKLVRRGDHYIIPNVMYSTAEKIYPRNEEFLINLKINIKQMLTSVDV